MIEVKKGEVFAFKTDTVWGFGVHPEDDVAIDKIYEIKKRDKRKPLILMSYSFEPLKKYVKDVPRYAYDLIDNYLPGGLTLILPKSDLCSSKVTQFETVGIRIPNSIDFLNLSKNIEGGVLATTSCNISSEPPVKNYSDAKNQFSYCATIIEPINDVASNNTPSTVILCEKEGYKVLREGAVKL